MNLCMKFSPLYSFFTQNHAKKKQLIRYRRLNANLASVSKTLFLLVSLVGIEILTKQSITAHLKFFVTLFLGDLSKKCFKEGLKDLKLNLRTNASSANLSFKISYFNHQTLFCHLFVADKKILFSYGFYVCL